MKIKPTVSTLLKKLTLVLLFCSFFTISYSQNFYHGLGAQVDIGFFKQEFSSSFLESSSSANPSVPGIFYKATIGLSEKFAVSAYPFIGFSGSANSRTGTSGSIGIQLPVVAELYFGEMDDACFFAGAGIAYASIGSTDFGSGNVFGPQFSLGGQFELAGRLVGVRAAFTHGINKSDIPGVDLTKDSHALFSLGGYYLLGQ